MTCLRCDDSYEWQEECGVDVCSYCGHHKDLARCYCGWGQTGGDGRQELIDMGETIDDDEYEYTQEEYGGDLGITLTHDWDIWL